MFERVVGACIAAGLVGGEGFAVDASLIQADGDQAQGFFFGRPVPTSEVGASILADFQKTLPTASSAAAQEAKLRLVKSSAER